MQRLRRWIMGKSSTSESDHPESVANVNKGGDRKPALRDKPPSIPGLELILAVGADMEPMVPEQDPSIVDWVEVAPPENESTEIIHSQCGHTGPKWYEVRLWGDRYSPYDEIRQLRCPACNVEHLAKVAIRCCVCGLPILPGDGVVFYNLDSVTGQDFSITTYKQEESGNTYALGCGRWNCCWEGIAIVGRWQEDGIITYDFWEPAETTKFTP